MIVKRGVMEDGSSGISRLSHVILFLHMPPSQALADNTLLNYIQHFTLDSFDYTICSISSSYEMESTTSIYPIISTISIIYFPLPTNFMSLRINSVRNKLLKKRIILFHYCTILYLLIISPAF